MLSLQPETSRARWPGDTGASILGQRVEECRETLKMPTHHQKSQSGPGWKPTSVFPMGTTVGMACR